MPTMLQALTATASFRIQQSILNASIQAKSRLGLDATTDRRQLRELAYDGPLYAAAYRLIGYVMLPMYDEHPDVAEFASDRVRTFRFDSVLSLSDARSTLDFQVANRAWFGGEEPAWEPGDSPSSGWSAVRLVDQCGNSLQSGEVVNGNIVWEPVEQYDEETIRTMLAKISELKSEAALEAGWDNFSTAKDLRDQYTALETKLACAAVLERVVQ